MASFYTSCVAIYMQTELVLISEREFTLKMCFGGLNATVVPTFIGLVTAPESTYRPND
jgi:hypothetical protein